jgi:multisubunit Na+/H+ antiporter MnhB subunit
MIVRWSKMMKGAKWGKGIVTGVSLAMPATLYLALAWGYLVSESSSPGLAGSVDSALSQSGVESRVTAVLLNFRAYDTLLECFVLFLGVVVVWSLQLADHDRQPAPVGSILSSTVRLLVPLLLLVGGYLLWAGSNRAGGAFQAGAIFGGVGVLLILTSSTLLARLPGELLFYGLCLGPFIFLLTALGTAGLGGYFLEYRRESAAMIIAALETVTAISIGLSLAALFGGHCPDDSCKNAVMDIAAPAEEENDDTPS